MMCDSIKYTVVALRYYLHLDAFGWEVVTYLRYLISRCRVRGGMKNQSKLQKLAMHFCSSG